MENYKEYYSKKKLLSDGSSNTKLAKNKLKTYGLSLIPHKLNDYGENLCKFSTKECRALCLNKSGRAGFTMVQQARLNKTNYFISCREEFLRKLYKELEDINSKGKAAVRLNVVSDVDWEMEFNKIHLTLGDLQNLTMYGYTKDPFQVEANNLNNQHFTFSYSGGNWIWCEKFLKEKRANVAMVFKNVLPLSYKGYKVISGDSSDERFLDEKGVIVGLKYKVPKGIPYTKNKFVIDE